MKRQPFGHIADLDGIRGLAALAVFLGHYFQYSARSPLDASRPIMWAANVAKFGFSGVDAFFVLSGFLITSILLRDVGNPHFFKDFYWKRVLRIMPVYLLHLLCVWQLSHGGGRYIVSCLLFVANFANLLRIQTLGPPWTLAIEEQFYIFWPQFVRRSSVQVLYGLSLSLVILCPILRMAGMFHGTDVYIYTFYRCDGLGLGALLACQMSGEGPSNGFVRKTVAALNSDVAFWVAVAVTLACMAAWSLRIAQPLYITSSTVLFYRLIRGVVRHGGSRKTSWLGSPLMVYLGAVSYALYMFHPYIFMLFFDHLDVKANTNAGHFWLGLPIALGLSLIVVTASRYWVELPIMRLRRVLLK
jgi:peptidoglycan/LPS O-acetylase OafA/YrhL